MPTYVIRQGDFLAPIAQGYGFTDPDVIWNLPENKPLRDAGRTQVTLAPGDELFLPERTERTLSGGTEHRYKAKVHVSVLKIRVVLQTLGGKALANASGTLHTATGDAPVTTDAKGQFETMLTAGTEAAELRLSGEGTTLHGIVIPLHIGHLDPVKTVSGQEARLNNLGYRAGIAGDAKAYAFRSAVEEFQCDEKLTVDGGCGPATQAKLQSVHGC
jgi:Putative peptidoglycan binding domain